MKYTISILVENHAGVLSRISGLFARRGFNIDSLAVGITNDPAVSRMTIVVDGNEYIVEQVEKQLNKLIDVIRLRRLEEGEKVSRELVLIKVECTPKTRSDIIDVVRVMDAKVSDLSKTRKSNCSANCWNHTTSLKSPVPGPSRSTKGTRR